MCADAAVSCFDAGADMLGVIYYPPSPRHVEIEQASCILDAVEKFRSKGKKITLVVVNELPEIIDTRFDYIQIHGKIEVDLIKSIRSKIIRVIRDIKQMENLLLCEETILPEQLFILELSRGMLPGGNGASWNWPDAKQFCQKFKSLIAGGVTPENVEEIIKSAEPFGVDVSSGVETTAGVKDMNKIKKLIDTVKKI
jgi:phosphoribosylanthranilate isomerase